MCLLNSGPVVSIGCLKTSTVDGGHSRARKPADGRPDSKECGTGKDYPLKTSQHGVCD